VTFSSGIDTGAIITGAEMLDQETVVTKERRHVLDVGALAIRAVRSAKEIHAVVHVGMEKDVGSQATDRAEGEVLPVTAFSKRPKERDRRAGDDAKPIASRARTSAAASSTSSRALSPHHSARTDHCATI